MEKKRRICNLLYAAFARCLAIYISRLKEMTEYFIHFFLSFLSSRCCESVKQLKADVLLPEIWLGFSRCCWILSRAPFSSAKNAKTNKIVFRLRRRRRRTCRVGAKSAGWALSRSASREMSFFVNQIDVAQIGAWNKVTVRYSRARN